MAATRLVTLSTTSASAVRSYDISGHTYSPDDGKVEGLTGPLDLSLEAVAEVSTLCNESRLEVREGKYVAIGLPTEAALHVLVEKPLAATLAGASSGATGAATSPVGRPPGW